MLSLSVCVDDTAMGGVVANNSQLTMATHVSLCRFSTFSFGSSARLQDRSLSAEAAKSLVQAFISCRLNYCNATYGVRDILLGRLQSVQNATVRLLTGPRRRDHISLVLKQLHYLPVRCRVEYKLAVLVFKLLQSQAPPYLAEECQLITNDPRRCHRVLSTNANVCTVPSTST